MQYSQNNITLIMTNYFANWYNIGNSGIVLTSWEDIVH